MIARARLDRITADLQRLVSVPSVTGEEEAAQALVAEMLAQAGLDVEQTSVPLEEVEQLPGFPGVEVERTHLPLVVGRIPGARPGPRRLLLGHIDVVPPGDPDTWTSPAFEPVVRDGRLYGRGACDMKGGVVAIIEAVRLIDRATLSGEVVVVSVPAEEDGGAGTFAALSRGVTADAAVITEPTGLDIVIAHAGAITFTLDVPGRAAHASMRREGVSALDNLTYLVAALVQDEARRNAAEQHPLMRAIGLPYPTIIGQVEGGTWASTVMDRVVAHGRYGVRLGQDGAGAGAELKDAIEEAAAQHPFLRHHPPHVSVWGGRFDSSSVPPDHPLPLGLADAAEAIDGARPPFTGVPYGADMRLLVNHGGIPTVMYGPGDVAVAHAADEHVPLADVGRCAETLATWVRDG